MDNYKLENIGKKTPYRVPENFFEDIENKIMDDIKRTSGKPKILNIILKTMTAAAILTILFTSTINIFNHHTDFDDIAQVFDQLPEEDQNYIIEIYNEDIFITQSTDSNEYFD